MYFRNFFVLAKSCGFFADTRSFSVISGDFALWRHSSSFDAILQDAQNQTRNCSAHVGAWSAPACATKFGSDRAIFYVFMTSKVHFFFTTFFSTSHGSAHPLLYLITNLQIAINCCIIAARPLTEGMMNVYTLCFLFCVFFNRYLSQAMHVSVSQTFIHNLLTYR